jgi:hypothetical protein
MTNNIPLTLNIHATYCADDAGVIGQLVHVEETQPKRRQTPEQTAGDPASSRFP